MMVRQIVTERISVQFEHDCVRLTLLGSDQPTMFLRSDQWTELVELCGLVGWENDE
jgi:hypothetical protein